MFNNILNRDYCLITTFKLYIVKKNSMINIIFKNIL